MADVTITLTLPDLQAARILKGFCKATGYVPFINAGNDPDTGIPILLPNPEKRQAWALKKIKELIINTAKEGEVAFAVEAAQTAAKAADEANPIVVNIAAV